MGSTCWRPASQPMIQKTASAQEPPKMDQVCVCSCRHMRVFFFVPKFSCSLQMEGCQRTSWCVLWTDGMDTSSYGVLSWSRLGFYFIGQHITKQVGALKKQIHGHSKEPLKPLRTPYTPQLDSFQGNPQSLTVTWVKLMC